MPAPGFAFYAGKALVTGCPCNARGQTTTVLRRWYPLHARSARLRLSVTGGPGRFAMNRRGAGTAEEPGGHRCFFDSMGSVRNTPTRRGTHAFTTLACLPAVKPNMAERAAAAASSAAQRSAAQQPQTAPGDLSGCWTGGAFQLRRISFSRGWSAGGALGMLSG